MRTLQFCAGVVIGSLVLPWVNSEVAKTAVMSAFTLAGTVVAAYVTAATTHDYLHRATAPASSAPPKPPPVQAKDEVLD
ncbi:MAG TPA: hypothetical protein VL974_03730 [Magnetospirillum sp.]|nr:hypothetical protein [Magnetospirillum sp.]